MSRTVDEEVLVLNRRQKSVLEDLVKATERATKLNLKSLERMKDHVNELGTDSAGGSRIDHLVIALIDRVRESKEQ